jgi:hypothetical protein
MAIQLLASNGTSVVFILSGDDSAVVRKVRVLLSTARDFS